MNPTQLEGLHETLQFVTFKVNNGNQEIRMALNVQKVKEVIEFESLSQCPTSCPDLLGIHDMRGSPIPIYDLTRFLSSGLSAGSTSLRRILICDLQNILIGIPVTSTGRILDCQSQDFLPPPSGSGSNGSGTEKLRMTSGIIRTTAEFLPVLDLDSFVSWIGLETALEANITPQSQFLAGKKILLAEDSLPVRKRIARLLESAGGEVLSAADGQQALDLLQAPHARVDLLFTDIEMPRLDGINLARKAKEIPQFAHLPVIFNSMLSNPALIADIEASGLGRYIVKFDEKQIFEELRKVLVSSGKVAA